MVAPDGGTVERLATFSRPYLPAESDGQVGVEDGRGAVVEADRVDADADDVALVDEQGGEGRLDAREVGHTGGVDVQEGGWIADPRIPPRVHRHEGAGGQFAVLRFPGEEVVDGQLTVGVARGAVADVDHAERRDELLDRQVRRPTPRLRRSAAGASMWVPVCSSRVS